MRSAAGSRRTSRPDHAGARHKGRVQYIANQSVRGRDRLRPDTATLLDRLFAALYDPAEVHDHVWRPGDFLLRDNFALQHGRSDQAATKRRRLRRIVGTEKSFFAQHPQFDITDPQMIAWNKGAKLMA
jgi:alpha-ketoglutarate-dependent taurine dioxygenase